MHCEVDEWSEWSPCSRSGRTCGFKRGQETRTRQVLEYPSPFGKPCPEISEIKECLVKRRKCPGKENNTVAKLQCVCVQCQILVIHHLNVNDQNYFLNGHILDIVYCCCCCQHWISTLYEFQALLVQSELAVLPLRTTTVYSEDCHCGWS